MKKCQLSILFTWLVVDGVNVAQQFPHKLMPTRCLNTLSQHIFNTVMVSIYHDYIEGNASIGPQFGQ